MRTNVRLIVLVVCGSLFGCDGNIYVRDGVTNGDTFYVPPVALTNPSPITQSWIAYSLALSTCQLQTGGPNPARNSSFQCEMKARHLLAERWAELASINDHDRYLDELQRTDTAGFIAEYTAYYLPRKGWQIPADLNDREFTRWRKTHLPHHRTETRIVGSWNYASKTRPVGSD